MFLRVQDNTCGFCMKNSDFWIRITSIYDSQVWPVILCMYKSVLSIWILFSIFPALICGFCMQNSDFWITITSFYVYQSSPVVLCMQNIVICTRIWSLYGYQTSPVVLCMQISVISTRITSLYGFQPSSVVLRNQNSNPLKSKLHVSMGPRPH